VAGQDETSKRRFRTFRKKLLSFVPVMRRRRHERILARMQRHFDSMQKYIDIERSRALRLGSLFLAPPSLASAATCIIPVPLQATEVDELCLFVTHAPAATLKPHVVDHVTALMDAGIAVILIVNADVELSALQFPEGLAARLDGCIVRQNIGFDFAAWAHAYCLLAPNVVRHRLYLINDSIVGPLSLEANRALLGRIRDASADFVGLTSNPDPHPHLQSFYLVFNERLLRSATLDAFFRRVVNMPEKQDAIDCYEIWLTSFLENSGFSSAAIFPNFSKLAKHRRNDTMFAWRELIDAGFPFIKSMVIRDPIEGAASRQMLPERYL
jgi:Rhamnan synthesis protein F